MYTVGLQNLNQPIEKINMFERIQTGKEKEGMKKQNGKM